MSFALTKEQFLSGKKDVTRRLGWLFLKPGDVVNAVDKNMGLKPGEKIQRLGEIIIQSTRLEPLDAITPEDVRREGFPDWTPDDFIGFVVKHYRLKSRSTPINRIEFLVIAESELLSTLTRKQKEFLNRRICWLCDKSLAVPGCNSTVRDCGSLRRGDRIMQCLNECKPRRSKS